MKNGRWISKELIHLNQYMCLLKTDIDSGNLESAKTNCGLAMGIVKGMCKREKKSLRGIDKVGGVVKFLYKEMKPFLKEAGKEALREYIREKKR